MSDRLTSKQVIN